MATDTAQIRESLRYYVALALSDAEDYVLATEDNNKSGRAGKFVINGDARKAALTDVLLSHRVVCMLRQLAEMLPAPPPTCGACGDVDRVNCAVCGPAC